MIARIDVSGSSANEATNPATIHNPLPNEIVAKKITHEGHGRVNQSA
ncbi:MAG: hypothetical protein AAGG48_31545 [Planctomycetota bacterium]